MVVSSVSPLRWLMMVCITIVLRQLNRIDGFGNSTDLVYFDQDAVGDSFINAFLQSFYIGYKKIITY